MSTQELLTFLFNAIALSFITIASVDFGTRLVVAYKQVSIISSSPKTNTQQPTNQLPIATNIEKLPQLPDPWLSLPVEEAVVLVKLVQEEQKRLQLLPPVKK